MDIEQKLALLTDTPNLDRSEPAEGVAAQPLPCGSLAPPLQKPLKKRRLWKVLQSNECVFDCPFCPWRSGRDTPRASLEPEDLAEQVSVAHRAGQLDGLFLSSGIRDTSVRSMDSALQTAEILRDREGYEGYLHLKIQPGSQRAQIQEAMRLADRVSLNLEAPNAERLSGLTRYKSFEDDLMERLRWVKDLTAEFPLKAGYTVQFVVGASGETDRELIAATGSLYREYGVQRVYFSPFRPVMGTPMESHPAVPAVREARLVQSDILLRTYGVNAGDIAFAQNGFLSAAVDPKMAQALNHPERFPLEVNHATYEELIKVPGIGPLSAKRLLQRSRERLILDPREVSLCGAVLKRAAPFILLNGRAVGHLEQYVRQQLRRLNDPPAVQLSFFDRGGEGWS